MSYPGVDPTDADVDASVGSVKTLELPDETPAEEQVHKSVKMTKKEYEQLVAAAEKGKKTTPLEEAANEAHEKALRGHQPPVTEDLNKAVEQAITDMFAVTDAWKPKIKVKFKIQCPSGQTALVKHLDTLDLVEHDLIEELDFFTRKLFPANIDASGNPEEAQDVIEDNIWKALKDVQKRCRFLDMTGKLMATASVNPKIIHDGVGVVDEVDEAGDLTGSKTTKFGYQMTMDEQLEHFNKPVPELKGSQAVYSGCIDFADRMAFFQELNKPLSLIEPFREEQVAVLQDLARSEGDGGEAK